MTLTIHSQEDEQRQLKLTVEVAEERVEKAMQQMARKLARDLQFPGFRKGKVPYQVVVRRIGREALRLETVEEITQDIFVETLEQGQIEPYAQPTLDNMELEPLVLKFTVPLSPVVKLGDYRAIRKEIEPVVVTEEAVDEALERLQNRRQKLEAVERPAELGDMVMLSWSGKLVKPTVTGDVATTDETPVGEGETAESAPETADDTEIFRAHEQDFLLDSFKLFPGTTFVEKIIGATAGEEKHFTIAFPEDYEDSELVGKEATFSVTVNGVKSREVPVLNDEFAQGEGDYATLADLRQVLLGDLEKAAEADINEKLLDGVVDDLLQEAELVYPPAAVEAEVADMLENFKNQVTRSGWQWDDFLKLQNETEDGLRNNFKETAVNRLRRRLVLQQFIADEKLRITPEDLEAAIEKRIGGFKKEDFQKDMREYYHNNEYARNMVLTEALMSKVYDRTRAVVSGNAPDLTEEVETETAETEETPVVSSTTPENETTTEQTETETAENAAE